MEENNNYAFIDNQNVYKSVQEQGWKLDCARFRIYLEEKYLVKKAYMFIGYLNENKKLYDYFEKVGYILVYKEISKDKTGKIKGNVDAELVLYSAKIEYYKYDKAIIVSGDGDFACLVKYLKEKNKLGKILVPNIKRYSCLLRKSLAREDIKSLCFLKDKLSK